MLQFKPILFVSFITLFSFFLTGDLDFITCKGVHFDVFPQMKSVKMFGFDVLALAGVLSASETLHLICLAEIVLKDLK
jgi:hypothetical protein